jgi:hypothetical protein
VIKSRRRRWRGVQKSWKGSVTYAMFRQENLKRSFGIPQDKQDYNVEKANLKEIGL